ncbi:hypothetical protein THASP1DRAFT_24662 [Thamnocephalis sphaerospora]|uniref:Uncharacterized protein n=1 Tax=Thamnocephalis sphaerospora TaxID=78915 RepID=A0A4P9XMI8_9FUNG|nr:hypothetical protein THASP1DRAFT_24662 [Thamnocephalis sphaerospora]|eukprot:RKP07124.1 hypothetical protein THASP1DRAFT_24662 [Thamnocephalis sphaerospora]
MHRIVPTGGGILEQEYRTSLLSALQQSAQHGQESSMDDSSSTSSQAAQLWEKGVARLKLVCDAALASGEDTAANSSDLAHIVRTLSSMQSPSSTDNKDGGGKERESNDRKPESTHASTSPYIARKVLATHTRGSPRAFRRRSILECVYIDPIRSLQKRVQRATAASTADILESLQATLMDNRRIANDKIVSRWLQTVPERKVDRKRMRVETVSAEMETGAEGPAQPQHVYKAERPEYPRIRKSMSTLSPDGLLPDTVYSAEDPVPPASQHISTARSTSEYTMTAGNESKENINSYAVDGHISKDAVQPLAPSMRKRKADVEAAPLSERSTVLCSTSANVGSAATPIKQHIANMVLQYPKTPEHTVIMIDDDDDFKLFEARRDECRTPSKTGSPVVIEIDDSDSEMAPCMYAVDLSTV